MRPPCASAIQRAMAAPSRFHPAARVRALLARTKRSKIFVCLAAGIPGPLSLTETSAVSPVRHAAEADFAAGGRVLQRVVEQDGGQLAEPVTVSADFQWFRVDRELDVPGVVASASMSRPRSSRTAPSGTASCSRFVSIGARQREQVFDRFRHRLGFGGDCVHLVQSSRRWSGRWRWRTSPLARSTASGVRSSCEASDTKRCWRSKETRIGRMARPASQNPPAAAATSPPIPPMLKTSVSVRSWWSRGASERPIWMNWPGWTLASLTIR